MIKELIALACCDNPTEREYSCQITYRTSSIHSATCTLLAVNVKHGARCAMGKVGGKHYEFAVFG